MEAYGRIVNARRRNTWSIILVLAVIAAVAYWIFYSDSKLGLVLGAIFTLVYIFQWAMYDTMKENEKIFGTAICPRCGAVIEQGKYLGGEIPKACTSCGLEIGTKV